jgi:hypothetical protein
LIRRVKGKKLNILMKNSKNIVLYSPFLNVKCKGHNFFQIYTFLDSEFSTLIENRKHFQFSQAVCAKSSGKLILFKTAGNINYLILCRIKICFSYLIFFVPLKGRNDANDVTTGDFLKGNKQD